MKCINKMENIFKKFLETKNKVKEIQRVKKGHLLNPLDMTFNLCYYAAKDKI